MSPELAERPEGADYQWRKIPLGEPRRQPSDAPRRQSIYRIPLLGRYICFHDAIVLSASIASAIVRVAMGGQRGELSRVRLRTHQPAAFNLARAGRRRPRLSSRKLQLHRI